MVQILHLLLLLLLLLIIIITFRHIIYLEQKSFH